MTTVLNKQQVAYAARLLCAVTVEDPVLSPAWMQVERRLYSEQVVFRGAPIL